MTGPSGGMARRIDDLERQNAALVDRVATLEQVCRAFLEVDRARSEAERCMSEGHGFSRLAAKHLSECVAILLGDPIIPNN